MKSTRNISSRLLWSIPLPFFATPTRRSAGQWSRDWFLVLRRSVWSLFSAWVLAAHPRGNCRRKPRRIRLLLHFNARGRRFWSCFLVDRHRWSYCLRRYSYWWWAWCQLGWNDQPAKWSYRAAHAYWIFQVRPNCNCASPCLGIIVSAYLLSPS